MDAQEKYIILCILATEINNGAQYEESHILRFGKRCWKLIDALAQYKQEFQTAIDEFESRNIRFTILKSKVPDGTCELAITYRRIPAKTNHIDLIMASTLLPLIFADYQIDVEQQIGYRTQDHLDKVYVTSELYNKVNERHRTLTKQITEADENNIAAKLPEVFQPELRGYQYRTVAWLMQREISSEDFIPSNYQQMQSLDGTTIVYKHKICLCFITKEEAMTLMQDFTLPPGGILADEMGLGKTVEMLALILLHPRREINNKYFIDTIEDLKDKRPLKRICLSNDVFCICTSKSTRNRIQCVKCSLWQHTKCVKVYESVITNDDGDADDNYLCPQCWMDVTQVQLIESGATFIVTPNTIKTQWLSEIKRHTKPSLRVFNYLGINSGQCISPYDLAQYDVVLTDYNVLRFEVYHTAKYRSDRKTRQPPAFMRYTSPLLMINWWRVCLDEAQMVESNTSKAAELAHMLAAINRWAVSGTPIQRSIHDLQPLFRFLGFNEFSEPQIAWNTVVNSFLLKHDTNLLIDILQKSLWRTCKANVQQELELPPQTEEIHRMQLSNIEMLHYREQHASCTEMFLQNVEKYIEDNDQASTLTNISPTLLKLVLQPLLKIRQGCTMPVLQTSNGKKNPTSGNNTQKQFVNPKELLQYMKNNNEQECKSQLRTWASSYNGIAAIFFIRNEYGQAIKQYELVLRLAKDYSKKSISVDTLLQIHALHNIIEANAFAEPEILSEQSLGNYITDLSTFEWKYLTPYMEVLTNARMAYKTSLEQYLRLQAQTNLNLIQFVSMLVENCGHVEEAIFNKIKDDCFAHGVTNSKIQELSTMWGILLVIEVWYKKIVKLKDNLCAEFEKLKFFTETATKQDELISIRSDVQRFVLSVSDCHLSDILDDGKVKENAPKKKKSLCKLCNIRRIINEFECLLFAKELDEETAATDGTETPAFEILLIKFIFNFLKTKSDFLEYQALFVKHWESLECLQSICKKQIKYWIEIEYTVKAFDELDMCKMRISLTDREEEKSNFRIMSYEVAGLEAEQHANLQEAQLKFTRLEGRLKYLKHLSEENSDFSCPICQTDEDDRYAVLECGHLVCENCLGIVMRLKKHMKPQCPICRSISNQVYYALKKPVIITQNVIGNHSSKVAYIVELVLKLRNEHPEGATKILIFSQWEAILKAISAALSENNVQIRLNCTPRAIEEFKDPTRKITCMLMPIARGSKGLNLIEATHVFLVEPILNPGEELQAVGRIHRFGQTKPTTVHRFIVKNTIEENIYNFIAAARCNGNEMASKHWHLESMTWQNIKDLFILDDTTF